MSWEAGERVIKPGQAFDIAAAVCDKLQLEAKFEAVGSLVSTWNCDLLRDGGFLTNGRGKGVREQSKTSALYEAIEHYIYENEDYSGLENIELDLTGIDKELVSSTPDLKLILGNHRATFSRLRFTDMGTSKKPLLFPAFLTNPDFASTDEIEQSTIQQFGLLRYSTNSGTASGVNTHEAALHALLEVIERDAIGVEMLRTVISKAPKPVRQIQLETLPENLKELSDSACAEASANLRLWDITTDLEIPVMLAELSGAHGIYFGSGAALSATYAAERAILEAVQGYHVYEILKSPRPLFGETSFEETSLFQKCFLEAGHFSFRGGVVLRDFDTVCAVDKAHFVTVSESLSHVVSHLERLGLCPYWRQLFVDELAVVQIVVPQLERFHLVTQGIPVMPSMRGRSHL